MGPVPARRVGGEAEDGEEPTQGALAGMLTEWYRKNLHLPIREQHQKLTEKLRGHYGYYGIIGNYSSLREISGGSAMDLATQAVSATPRQAHDWAEIRSSGET